MNFDDTWRRQVLWTPWRRSWWDYTKSLRNQTMPWCNEISTNSLIQYLNWLWTFRYLKTHLSVAHPDQAELESMRNELHFARRQAEMLKYVATILLKSWVEFKTIPFFQGGKPKAYCWTAEVFSCRKLEQRGAIWIKCTRSWWAVKLSGFIVSNSQLIVPLTWHAHLLCIPCSLLNKDGPWVISVLLIGAIFVNWCISFMILFSIKSLSSFHIPVV